MNSSIHGVPFAALGVAVLAALAVGTSSAMVQEPDGAALYRQQCRSCHGAKGVPTPRMVTLYPRLRALDSTFLATLSTDSIVAGLRHGLPEMKPFADKLSEREMMAVARFVKTLADSASAP